MSNEEKGVGIGMQYRTRPEGGIEVTGVSLVAEPLEDCARITNLEAGAELEALIKNGVPVPKKYPRGKNPHSVHIDDAAYFGYIDDAAWFANSAQRKPTLVAGANSALIFSLLLSPRTDSRISEVLEESKPSIDHFERNSIEELLQVPMRASVIGLSSEDSFKFQQMPNAVLTEKQVVVVGADFPHKFNGNEMKNEVLVSAELPNDFNEGKQRLAKDEEWTREGNNKKWRRPGIDAKRKKMAKASKKRNRR